MNLKKYMIALVVMIGFVANSNVVAKSEEDIKSIKGKLQSLMRDYRLPPIREFNVHPHERDEDLSEEQRRARRILIEQDLEENLALNTQDTVLQWAIHSTDLTMVSALLNRGAELNPNQQQNFRQFYEGIGARINPQNDDEENGVNDDSNDLYE